MKKFPFVVEAIVFFACASTYTLRTIETEFIYQVVSEKHDYTANHSVEYCHENRTHSKDVQQVTEDASRWIMYTNVVRYMSCSMSALIITTWSEVIGRKYALLFPLTGEVISTTFQAFIIYYRLPLYLVVLNGLIYGLFGGYAAMMDISSAYLSDTTRRENRGKRFTVLEVSSSVGGGVVLVGTGYWIKTRGFIPSSFFIVGCAVTALALVLLVNAPKTETDKDDELNSSRADRQSCDELESTDGTMQYELKITDDKEAKKNSSMWNQMKVVWRIYTTDVRLCDSCMEVKPSGKSCFHENRRRRGRLWRLWFYILSYSWYMFAMKGIDSFQTLFFISYPVCFSPVLVGAQNGLDSCIILFSPLLVMVYQMIFRMDNQSILLTSICARITTSVMMYYSHGAPLIFAATSLGLFSTITTPFLRSQVSSLVSKSEQGPAFALMSGTSGIINTLSPVAFLRIYPASLHISFGFTWLVPTLILCIPLTLMISVFAANKLRSWRVTKDLSSTGLDVGVDF